MDHHTRKPLGFTDKNLSFSENWLTERTHADRTCSIVPRQFAGLVTDQ